MMHVALRDHGFRSRERNCDHRTMNYYHPGKGQSVVVERLTSRLCRAEIRNGDGIAREADTVRRLVRVLSRLP